MTETYYYLQSEDYAGDKEEILGLFFKSETEFNEALTDGDLTKLTEKQKIKYILYSSACSQSDQ